MTGTHMQITVSLSMEIFLSVSTFCTRVRIILIPPNPLIGREIRQIATKAVAKTRSTMVHAMKNVELKNASMTVKIATVVMAAVQIWREMEPVMKNVIMLNANGTPETAIVPKKGEKMDADMNK